MGAVQYSHHRGCGALNENDTEETKGAQRPHHPGCGVLSGNDGVVHAISVRHLEKRLRNDHSGCDVEEAQELDEEARNRDARTRLGCDEASATRHHGDAAIDDAKGCETWTFPCYAARRRGSRENKKVADRTWNTASQYDRYPRSICAFKNMIV